MLLFDLTAQSDTSYRGVEMRRGFDVFELHERAARRRDMMLR